MRTLLASLFLSGVWVQSGLHQSQDCFDVTCANNLARPELRLLTQACVCVGWVGRRSLSMLVDIAASSTRRKIEIMKIPCFPTVLSSMEGNERRLDPAF